MRLHFHLYFIFLFIFFILLPIVTVVGFTNSKNELYVCVRVSVWLIVMVIIFPSADCAKLETWVIMKYWTQGAFCLGFASAKHNSSQIAAPSKSNGAKIIYWISEKNCIFPYYYHTNRQNIRRINISVRILKVKMVHRTEHQHTIWSDMLRASVLLKGNLNHFILPLYVLSVVYFIATGNKDEMTNILKRASRLFFFFVQTKEKHIQSE